MNARYRNVHERVVSRGLDAQIVQEHFFERTDRGVADRNLGVNRFAHARQDHAFDEGRAGADEIDRHQQQNKKEKDERNHLQPAAARSRLLCRYVCICHKFVYVCPVENPPNGGELNDRAASFQ